MIISICGGFRHVEEVLAAFMLMVAHVGSNPDVSQWDTSNVTDMSGMFADAKSADPDVGRWDTSNVTDMSGMFAGVRVAVPDMSRWDFSKVTCYAYMFSEVTLPTTTYSSFLLSIVETSDKQGDELCTEISCLKWNEEEAYCIKWGRITSPLVADKSKYNAEAAVARQQLIDRGWKIKDGGQERRSL